MLLVFVSILFLIEHSGNGNVHAMWLFLFPVSLGIIGGVFAVRERAYFWAAGSVLLGLLSLQIVGVAITMMEVP